MFAPFSQLCWKPRTDLNDNIWTTKGINAIESSIKVKGKLSTNNDIAPFLETIKQNHNTVSQPYYNIISLKIKWRVDKRKKQNSLRVTWPFERYNMKSQGNWKWREQYTIFNN